MYYGDDDDIVDIRRFKLEMKGSNELVIIGMNPSTARGVSKNCTEWTDDMTIKRVRSFSNQNWNYDVNKIRFDGFLMLNVCAQVATAPKDLEVTEIKKFHELNISKIGRYLQGKNNAPVLLAYGNLIDDAKKDVKDCLNPYLREIVKILNEDYHAKFFCMGMNGGNKNPRHLSRISYKTKMVEIDKAWIAALLN